MPGVFNLSVDEAVKEVEAARSEFDVLLFGLPITRTASDRRRTIERAGAVPQCARSRAPRPTCWSRPTSPLRIHRSRHCGIIVDEVSNDPTVEQLVRAAVSHAAAGPDIMAPSDMMDGRVGVMSPRRGWLREHRRDGVRAALVGVLRTVPRGGRSAPKFGDRASYQMDPANVDEAMRGRSGHRRGRRYRDGEARPALSRRVDA